MKTKILFSSLLLSRILVADCTCYGNRPSCEECSTQRPSSCCLGTFGAGGSWLFMRPFTSEIEYGRIVEEAEESNPVVFEISDKCISTKYASGFEVYAFYQSLPLCSYFSWDLQGSFVSHDFSKKESKSVVFPKFIIPLVGFIPNESANQFFLASTKIRLDFMHANGELGLTAFSENPFSIRLFGGVQYANLKQKIEVSYQDPTETSTLNSQLPTTFVSQLAKFNGIGPRFGFNGVWDIYCGLNFFGDFAVNLLFAEKKGRFFQETDVATLISPAESNFQAQEEFCHSQQFIPNLDIRLGLGFQFNLFRRLSIGIEGGYRALHYFDALQLYQITSSSFSSSDTPNFLQSKMSIQSEDYSLAGWFVGGNLQF